MLLEVQAYNFMYSMLQDLTSSAGEDVVLAMNTFIKRLLAVSDPDQMKVCLLTVLIFTLSARLIIMNGRGKEVVRIPTYSLVHLRNPKNYYSKDYVMQDMREGKVNGCLLIGFISL